MPFRRVAATDPDDREVHLFEEGHVLTLCDKYVPKDWRVKGDAEEPTCRQCVTEAARRAEGENYPEIAS